MTRSGIRVADIFNQDLFESKLRRLAFGFSKRYGDLLNYDVEAEISKFQKFREELQPFVVDQTPLLESAKQWDAKDGPKILVEGANAIMLDIGRDSLRHSGSKLI